MSLPIGLNRISWKPLGGGVLFSSGAALPIGLNRISWKHNGLDPGREIGGGTLPIGLNRISWKLFRCHPT